MSFEDWISDLTPELLDKLEGRYLEEMATDIKEDALKVALYMFSREQGQAPRFAEMAASRTAPGTKGSDRAFNQNARARMESMTPEVRSRILKRAKQAGVDTTGKFYVSGLGKYHEQQAWVSTVDDIRDVARANPNLTIRGAVNQEGRQTKEIEKVELAEDLVQGLMCQYLQSPKEREAASRGNGMAALRDKVIAKHGAKANRNYRGSK